MRAFIGLILAALAVPAFAQQCETPTGWNTPRQIRAAQRPINLRTALEPGDAVQLQLPVQRGVVLATKQGKKGWAGRHAGLAAIDVDRAGTLQVALSSKAYVDLVREGTTLKSKAHGHGCDGVFKNVSFDVTPGRYIIQITDSQAMTIKVGTILK